MADQVNPTGSLAPGLAALMAASPPRPATDKSRNARPAGASPEQAEARPRADSLKAAEEAQAKQKAEATEPAVAELNNYLQDAGTDLKFQLDEATGRTVFKVVSHSSGEVLLQVPSEEMLAMARKLRELAQSQDASGVLMDHEG